MALPSEPLEDLLGEAYLAVEAEVVSEIERGPHIPHDARPDGWTGPADPLPWQVVRLRIREVLFGSGRPRELTVFKPAEPYELKPGAVPSAVLLGNPTPSSHNLPVVLGRYGPSYDPEIVRRALSAIDLPTDDAEREHDAEREQEGPSSGGPRGGTASGSNDLVAASNGLTASWVRTHRSGNTALSGVGCWILLSVLAPGAGGDARSELADAVGLPAERSLQATGSMLSLLRSIGPLETALGVWARVVLDPEWVDGLPAGVLGQLTDDPEEDQRRIDQWVDEATGGELSRLPVPASPNVMLMLVSALTLQTEWEQPFKESGGFRTGPWADQDVTRLVASTTAVANLRIAETAAGTLTVLRIPAAGDVDVHLVLGDAAAEPGSVLAAGISTLTGTDHVTGEELGQGRPAPGVHVETVTSTEPDDRLRVETCAFDLRASHDLRYAKHVLGLDSAMDGSRGHFPGISPTPLAVDEARQEVTATFNQTGFRATAVMAVSMGIGSSQPPVSEEYSVRRISVSFDRPFGFLATHRLSSLVLIAGWVQSPSAGDRDDPGRAR